MNVINMLNTKYFIVPDSASGQVVAHRNPEALGNAWLVNGVRFVANADEEMEALTVATPRTTAVVDKRFRSQIDISKIIQLDRSEEHTSELQSLMRISYAVFCLKKKKIKNINMKQ